MSIRLLTSFVAAVLGGVGCADVHAQELDARISINHSQVQGTDASVFDDLEQNLTRFVNERQWTSMQFYKNERIQCSFNITVTKYDKASNVFTCKAVVQANRPVYNASYTTTLYSNTDNDFNFEYAQFDQIQFNEEQVDNQLTALMAYYAYLIIGLDLDSFAPMARCTAWTAGCFAGSDGMEKCCKQRCMKTAFSWVLCKQKAREKIQYVYSSGAGLCPERP